MTVTDIIANWKKAQESGAVLPCPRCGWMKMKEKLCTNALSRRADVYICDSCGTAEALEDFYREPQFNWAERLVSEWFILTSVYSGQQIAQKVGSRFFIRSTSEVVVTEQDIDDIMATALEGGINYWCDGAEVVGEYLGQYASDQISRDGELMLYDVEECTSYMLTLEMFLNGVVLAIEKGYATDWLEGNHIDTCNIDAEAADVIIQMALFGDVIYG